MATINVDETHTALPICPQKSHQQQEESIFNDRDIREILERKLGSDDDFRLVSWKLVHLHEVTTGLLGHYYRLYVTYARADNEPEQVQFFVKTQPIKYNQRLHFVQLNDIFNKESIFYTDVMRQMGTGGLPKWIPNCYLSKRDVAFVLDDLTVDGYTLLDKYTSLDEEHCVWMMRTFSRLHSRSLIFDEKLRKEECGRTVYDLYGHVLKDVFYNEKEISHKMLNSAIKGFYVVIDFTDELDDDAKTDVKRWCSEWSRELLRLLAPSSEHRNVICHRDPWINNLMFRHDSAGSPNGCCLIDFQFSCYCPPAIDLMLFFYLTVDRATRDRLYEKLIRIYYESLTEYLAEEGLEVERCLPWTAFRKSLAETRNTALLYAAFNLQVIPISKVVWDIIDNDEKIAQILSGPERLNIMSHVCQNVSESTTRLVEIALEIKEHLSERPLGAS